LQRVHYGGNESINCNGTGALGQLQQQQGTGQRGNGNDRSVTCNGTGAGALGHWGNCNSTGALGQQEAMATGQRHSHCDRSIVCVCVDVDVWGAGVGVVYSVFYSKKLVNAKKTSE
jgi:hypothetical protein